MIDFLQSIYNSDATQLSTEISKNLEALDFAKPSNEQILELVRKYFCINSLAHAINEYHVSLLKGALLTKVGSVRDVIEKLLSVQYHRVEDNPAKDYCKVYFLHYMVEDPTCDDIKSLCKYLQYYLSNLHSGGINAHVSFSVKLPRQAINELIENKLERYLCPLTFPSCRLNTEPETKAYLLDVGLMREHDIETKHRLGFFSRTVKIIDSYNQFIFYTENFLPDYLIINLAEQ